MKSILWLHKTGDFVQAHSKFNETTRKWTITTDDGQIEVSNEAYEWVQNFIATEQAKQWEDAYAEGDFLESSNEDWSGMM